MDRGGPSELFIGLVAAVGTNIELVITELESELAGYHFDSTLLRLSSYLEAHFPDRQLASKPYDVRIHDSMTAGDDLREAWQRNDALVLLAIEDVVASRAELSTDVLG